MKIFFNGSTLISGELHESFANEYNAEFLNLADPKYCNHAIWRTTLEESPVSYDLAIIEFTKASKMEYFNGKEWVDFIDNERISKYWYENLYTEEFGVCDENFAVEALRDYFTINNTDSIIIAVLIMSFATIIFLVGIVAHFINRKKRLKRLKEIQDCMSVTG